MRWENLWSFKTRQFAVLLDWTEEPDPDLSFDETGEAEMLQA